MRHTIATTALSVLLSFNVSAQNALRHSVGVIRPHNNKNTETFFRNYASVLQRQGYHNAAQYVASIGGSSFGSCFVVQGNDGRYYAITNRHAVEFADSAMIQFIDGRDTITYDGLQVAKVSEDLDLAAIVLPEGVAFTPLSVYNGHINDGAEVFTAGFPSVSGKPSWQFGKGIVSNSQFYNDLLTNDSNRWVIQHTAQIDAGSSGGPLLVPEGSEYLVAGVNTWKVSNRDEMNLSISNHDLRQFISTLGTPYRENAEEIVALYNHIETDIQNGYRNILPHLSYTYMFYMTSTKIDRSFNDMPKVLREDIDNLMKIGHFTEALRLLSAYNAAKQIAENPFEFESMTPSGDEIILHGADKMEVVFAWEKGAWRITKVGHNSSRKKASSNVTDAYGIGITDQLRGTMLQFGVSFPIAGNIAPESRMGIHITSGWSKRFTTYELMLEYNNIFTDNYIGLGFRFGGQLPIKLSPHVIISPNIKAELGSDMPVGNVNFNYSFIFVGGIGGVDAIFRLGNLSSYMIIGAAYEHRGLLPVFGKRDRKIDNIGYISAHIGFIF